MKNFLRNNKKFFFISLIISILAYLTITIRYFLPECLIVWYPGGVNEFIFCFILPPAFIAITYLLYKIKTVAITLITVLIILASMVIWFGPKFFVSYFTHSHLIFHDCVLLLDVLGNVFGISYVAINVILFAVIEPIILLTMVLIIRKQKEIIKDRNVSDKNAIKLKYDKGMWLVICYLCLISILVIILNPEFVFGAYVVALVGMAHLFNLSYEAVNILVFCLIVPLVFLFMLRIIIRNKKILKNYNKEK